MGLGTPRSPPAFWAIHPMAMAGYQAVVQLQEGSVLAAPVLAHLWAMNALGSKVE